MVPPHPALTGHLPLKGKARSLVPILKFPPMGSGPLSRRRHVSPPEAPSKMQTYPEETTEIASPSFLFFRSEREKQWSRKTGLRHPLRGSDRGADSNLASRRARCGAGAANVHRRFQEKQNPHVYVSLADCLLRVPRSRNLLVRVFVPFSVTNALFASHIDEGNENRADGSGASAAGFP